MKMTEQQKKERREAKAAREAEEQLKYEKELAEFRASVPVRLLKIVARASVLKLGCLITGVVADPEFIRVEISGFGEDPTWEKVLTTDSAEWEFKDLENMMLREEEARAEEARKVAVRKVALEKVKAALTEEEFQLLNGRTF